MELPPVALLNGPDMNLSGPGEPTLHGTETLDDLEQICAEIAIEPGLAIDFRQTGSEGDIIPGTHFCSWVIHPHPLSVVAWDGGCGNASTSAVLMGTLRAVELPAVEVRHSNSQS